MLYYHKIYQKNKYKKEHLRMKKKQKKTQRDPSMPVCYSHVMPIQTMCHSSKYSLISKNHNNYTLLHQDTLIKTF